MSPTNNTTKRRIYIKVIAVLIIAVFIWFALGILISDNLEIESISATTSPSGTKIKIAHISDIHYPDNKIPLSNILQEVVLFEPDLVFLTGDMLTSKATTKNVEEFAVFLKELKRFSHVYAVLGNHELILSSLNRHLSDMSKYGIILLDNEVITITVNKRTIAIAGISDKESYGYASINNLSCVSPATPVVLLAHRPEKWEEYLAGTPHHTPVAVFSGHAHGGQLQILGRGVYAPGYGYFPKYYDGLYKNKQTDNVLVVSRGLGDSIFPFRLYNRYHLPLVTLTI